MPLAEGERMPVSSPSATATERYQPYEGFYPPSHRSSWSKSQTSTNPDVLDKRSHKTVLNSERYEIEQCRKWTKKSLTTWERENGAIIRSKLENVEEESESDINADTEEENEEVQKNQQEPGSPAIPGIHKRELSLEDQIALKYVNYLLRRSQYEAMVHRVSQVLPSHWNVTRGSHIAAPMPKNLEATSKGEVDDASTEATSNAGADEEMHAIFVSPEEVISRCPNGNLQEEDMAAFARKYPGWYVVREPNNLLHAKDIIDKAQNFDEKDLVCIKGDTIRPEEMSEEFTNTCFSEKKEDEDSSTAAVAIGGAAAGAAAAISAPVIAAGIALGRAIAIPAWLVYDVEIRRSSERIPFAIVNTSDTEKYRARVYRTDETWFLAPIQGFCGKSEGDVDSDSILHLNPPDDDEEFLLKLWETEKSEEVLCTKVKRGGVYRLVKLEERKKNAFTDELDKPIYRLVKYEKSILPAYGGATCKMGSVMDPMKYVIERDKRRKQQKKQRDAKKKKDNPRRHSIC